MIDSKFFRFSFLLAMLCLPLYRGALPLWSFSAAAALLAIPLFYQAVLPKRSAPLWVRTELDIFFLVYAAVFAISAVFSDLPYRSIVEAYKLIIMLLIFRSTLLFCRDRADVRLLASSLVFLAGALSLFGLVQYLGGLPKPWWHRPELLSSVYINHNHFSGLLELAIPIALGLILSEKDPAKRVLYVFMATLSAGAFVLAGSRGGIISLAAALFFMFCLLGRKGAFKKLYWVFFGATILAAAGYLIFQSNRLLWDRLLIWQGAAKIIFNNFFLGTGPGTFEYAFLSARPIAFPHRPVHAHNDYLEVLADGGIFLFLSAAALFGAFFVKGLRVLKNGESRTRTYLGASFLAAFAALLVHALFDFNFRIPANLAWLVAIGAMMIALDNKYPAQFSQASLVDRLLSAVIGLLLFSGVLVIGVSDFFYERGKVSWERKDASLALQNLDRAILLNPFNAAYFNLRGKIRAHQKMSNASLDLYNAVRLNPYEPYYALHRAQFAMGQLGRGDAEKLIPVFNSILQKDPRDPGLCLIAARTLYEKNHDNNKKVDDAAFAWLGQAVMADPKNSYSIFELLWKVHPDINTLKRFQERFPQGIHDFVRFLENKGFWNEHREYFLKSLSLDPAASERLSRQKNWGAAEIVAGEKITLRSKPARVIWIISAKPVKGVYPYGVVLLDGKPVDAFYLNSPRPKTFYTVLSAPPGIHRLSIQILNDRKYSLDKIQVQYADA